MICLRSNAFFYYQSIAGVIIDVDVNIEVINYAIFLNLYLASVLKFNEGFTNIILKGTFDSGQSQ
jgi:hypothetical protein